MRLTTRDVALRFDVTTTTVKRWADQGLLRHTRTAGGHRRFEEPDVVRLLELRDGTEDPWLLALARDGGVRKMVAALKHLREEHGSWAVAAEALGDGIRQIGEAWAVGRITLFEEHLVTERVVRAIGWISSDIDAPKDAPVALLGTAEGEVHRLGVYLAELVLRESGWKIAWGVDAPTDALVPWARKQGVELVVMTASSWMRDSHGMRAQVKQLSRGLRVPILLGGSAAWPTDLPNVHRVRAFADFQARLRGMRPTTMRFTPLAK